MIGIIGAGMVGVIEYCFGEAQSCLFMILPEELNYLM